MRLLFLILMCQQVLDGLAWNLGADFHVLHMVIIKLLSFLNGLQNMTRREETKSICPMFISFMVVNITTSFVFLDC